MLIDEQKSVGRVGVADQALAVPAKPASGLDASRFDPSRVRFEGMGLRKKTRAGNERKAARLLRPYLVERQNNRCHYCKRRMTAVKGHPLRGTDGTVEHLTRRADGGALSLQNCVAACYDCNLHQDAIARRRTTFRHRLRAILRRIDGWLTRDSDGNPKGGDGTAPSRSDDSAGPKDIAQPSGPSQ